MSFETDSKSLTPSPTLDITRRLNNLAHRLSTRPVLCPSSSQATVTELNND